MAEVPTDSVVSLLSWVAGGSLAIAGTMFFMLMKSKDAQLTQATTSLTDCLESSRQQVAAMKELTAAIKATIGGAS